MADRKSFIYSRAVAAYFNPRFNGAPAEDRIEAVVDSVLASLDRKPPVKPKPTNQEGSAP